MKAADVRGLQPVLVIGLDIDLEGAPELIELIDISRAEIALQGIEHIIHIHPELARLDPVHRDRDLRRAGAEGGDDALDAGLSRGVGGDGLRHALKLHIVLAVVEQLDLHLEPAGIPDALNRRRNDDKGDGVGDL